MKQNLKFMFAVFGVMFALMGSIKMEAIGAQPVARCEPGTAKCAVIQLDNGSTGTMRGKRVETTPTPPSPPPPPPKK